MSPAAEVSNFPKFLRRDAKAVLRLLNPPLLSLILNLRHIDLFIEGVTFQERVSELSPPAKLFSADVHNYPKTYKEIYDFLSGNGVDLLSHSSKLIIDQLERGLCDVAHDKDAALGLSEDLIARENRRHSTLSKERKRFAPVTHDYESQPKG